MGLRPEAVGRLPDPAFWAGRRVLLTGHTGFKGSWAALWLARMGARVTGLALQPEGAWSHFALVGAAGGVDGRITDLRDAKAVADVVRGAAPEAALHLGAQALVLRGLREPAATFAVNVMGTAHLLEALRSHAPEAVTLVATSDKVYANDGSGAPFAEDAPLGGADPYSASKAACELLVASWRAATGMTVATARAGNVIGGGDFAETRIAPDVVRAALERRPVLLRHPQATRPWQHVLDCLCGYLLHLEALAREPATAPAALNFGPAPGDPVAVARVAETIGRRLGLARPWVAAPATASAEASALALDAARARAALGWRERLPGAAAIAATADWYGRWMAGEDVGALSRAALDAYGA